MKKACFISVLALLFTLCLVFTSCDSSDADVQTDAPVHRVMVSASEGITVLPEAAQEVKEGESAVFNIQFADNYVFESTDFGVFDPVANTLTVENVTKATLVTLKAVLVEYESDTLIRYWFFKTNAADKSSVPNDAEVPLGTEVTVTAGDMKTFFAGWMIGDGPSYISNARTYTFRITPEMVKNNSLMIKPKYISLDSYSYDANGGTIDSSTPNAKSNTYAAKSISGSKLSVTLSAAYLDKITCATAFWNDGTFTRDGYVLKEYNTKPDGSGEAISPGAKVFQYNSDGSDYVLYCIWEKAEPSFFTYEPYTMALPSGIKKTNAPDWVTDGIMITGYTGDAKTVAIPEKIDGKTVIAVKSGAFKDKAFTTLLMPRTLQEVQNGAVIGCSSLKTLYFPSGLWSIHDEAFDEATYKNFTDMIVYASIAPRFATATSGGGWGIKLSYLMSTQDQNRIICIAGSSTYQGLSTEYLEALFDHDYAVINFGTTRTTHGALYLEAMQHYAHEGDIVIFAPENSIYMMGDTALYWKTLRDMDPLYQFFRYVDISNYTDVFDAFTDLNQNYAYKNSPGVYENVAKLTSMNKYGDHVNTNKNVYVNQSSTKYADVYHITFNNRVKSTNEGDYEKAGFQSDYSNNTYWVSLDDSPYKDLMNHAIRSAKKSGAKVYFGFAPADASSVVEEVRNTEWLNAYDTLIQNTYEFDASVGSCKNYIFAREYFFDCAFHTNNYGRTYRTYMLYKDLCPLLGREVKYQNGDLGTDFDQCLFEKDADGKVLKTPLYPVDFLK